MRESIPIQARSVIIADYGFFGEHMAVRCSLQQAVPPECAEPLRVAQHCLCFPVTRRDESGGTNMKGKCTYVCLLSRTSQSGLLLGKCATSGMLDGLQS